MADRKQLAQFLCLNQGWSCMDFPFTLAHISQLDTQDGFDLPPGLPVHVDLVSPIHSDDMYSVLSIFYLLSEYYSNKWLEIPE
jgi:hypothetical protein